MTELDPSVCSSAHVGGTPTLMSVDSLSSELKRVQRWDHRNRPGFWPGRQQLFLPLTSVPLMGLDGTGGEGAVPSSQALLDALGRTGGEGDPIGQMMQRPLDLFFSLYSCSA